jgi:hypothetical protein
MMIDLCALGIKLPQQLIKYTHFVENIHPATPLPSLCLKMQAAFAFNQTC